MANYHAAAYLVAFILFLVAAFETRSGVGWQWLACACLVLAFAL